MQNTIRRRTSLASAFIVLVLATSGLTAATAVRPADLGADPGRAASRLTGNPTCAPTPPDPFLIRLVPTAHANGSMGEVRLRFADSPFGATLTRDGHHVLSLDMKVDGLELAAGTIAMVWATSPDLGTVIKLGALAEDGTLAGRISLNKFLVFLTAEPSPDVDRWSGPVLLRGSSPSGRMHSMAGHGPFEGEPCAVVGF